MTFDKWASRTFLTIGEAVDYLSVKSLGARRSRNPNRVGAADVLRSALDGSLPLVVDVATGTEDGEGRPIEAGLWDLPLEGAGRQQVEYDWRLRAGLSPIDMDGVAGAVVERDGVQRQLEPMSGSPWSAFSAGCVLGARREALDALLAEKMLPADARDKDLDPRERNSLMYIIAGLVYELDGTRYEVDLEQTSKGAVQIEAMTERIGHRVSARAAVEKLKEIEKLLPKK